MTGEKDPIPRPGLSPKQLQLLNQFLAIGRDHRTTTLGQVHAMDQATAFMRTELTKRGAKIDAVEDYFYVVAGLNVGTIWVAGMLVQEPEYDIKVATRAMKVSFDRLAPPESRRFDEPQNPADIWWYDQSSAFVRNFLVETMGQDISNARIFDQTAAGMTVGTEWMEGLINQGYPPGQAAFMSCVSCALLAPNC